MTTTLEDRIDALAAFLAIDPDGISSVRDQELSADGAEYLVLTDEEADERVREYIADSLWAFRPSFLASETDMPEEVFAVLQKQCEDANEPIRKIVDKTCGLEALVEAAVSADGRGHLLSSYDGDEQEQGHFFIYRTN